MLAKFQLKFLHDKIGQLLKCKNIYQVFLRNFRLSQHNDLWPLEVQEALLHVTAAVAVKFQTVKCKSLRMNYGCHWRLCWKGKTSGASGLLLPRDFSPSHIPQNNEVIKCQQSIVSLCWKYGVFSQYTYGRKTQRAVQEHIPCRTASSIAVRSFAISFQRFSSNRIVQQLSDLLPGRWWNPYTDKSLAGNKKKHSCYLDQAAAIQLHLAI